MIKLKFKYAIKIGSDIEKGSTVITALDNGDQSVGDAKKELLDQLLESSKDDGVTQDDILIGEPTIFGQARGVTIGGTFSGAQIVTGDNNVVIGNL